MEEKTQKWLKKLLKNHPDKFWGTDAVLQINGCHQYIYSALENEFANYSQISPSNTIYNPSEGTIEFYFWKENRLQDDFIQKITSYKELEQKCLELYDFVQIILKKKQKEHRIHLIEEL